MFVPPSPWSVNTVLLVLVFAVTSATVYHWAHEHAKLRSQLSEACKLGVQFRREAHQPQGRHKRFAVGEGEGRSEQQQGPGTETAFSPPLETLSPGDAGGQLLSTSLLAGLAMMVGVGMFAAGAAMESTLTTVDQVPRVLGVPVAATVTLPGLKPTRSGRHRGWLRLAFCFGGAVLMAGCLALVFQLLEFTL